MARRKWNLQTIQQIMDGQNPFIQVGYTGNKKPEKKHKEGEVWTDKNGSTWIKTKSGKISKKLYDLRESTRQICPECGQDVYWSNNKLDRKFFNMTGKCFDCKLKEETIMRLNGTFEIYEKKKILQNKLAVANEFKQKLQESINYLENFNGKLKFRYEETNTEETWTDNNTEIILQEALKDMIMVNNKLKELESDLNNIEQQEIIAKTNPENNGK